MAGIWRRRRTSGTSKRTCSLCGLPYEDYGEHLDTHVARVEAADGRIGFTWDCPTHGRGDRMWEVELPGDEISERKARLNARFGAREHVRHRH
jgi:hypothetical protein